MESARPAIVSNQRRTATNTEPKVVRVLLVDDHPVVRAGLVAILATEDGIEVIGEAPTAADAMKLFRALKPDVVLMDLILPDVQGMEAIEQVCNSSSDVGVIVLTSASGDEEIYRAFDAGARAFLFKETARTELADAIRTVARGKRYASGAVGIRLAETMPRMDLSQREIEVLRRIAVGRRNKEIAFELGISEATVNVHVKHLLQKLNADDRTGAVTIALRRGIIRL